MADEMGIDAFSTTEHHFQSEGFEASVAPLLIYADQAARTERIIFAPLGLVLPSRDPIRCAEELAILGHLTQGRVIPGFARGYQDRWGGLSRLLLRLRLPGSFSDPRRRGLGSFQGPAAWAGVLLLPKGVAEVTGLQDDADDPEGTSSSRWYPGSGQPRR